MAPQLDPIIAADEAEERSAAFALRCAQTKAELTAAWSFDCDHFKGAARERLQDEYRIRLRQLGISLE